MSEGNNSLTIKKKLISKRRNMKTKLELLKHGEMLQETAFNPITRRLKSIESTLHHQQQQQHSSGEEKKGKTQRENKADDDYDNDEIKSLLQSSLPKQLKSEPMETIPVVESDGDEEEAPHQQLQYKLPIRTFRPRHSINSGDYTALDNDDDDGGGRGGAKAHRARNLAEESLMEYLDQYDSLPRKYIREMYEDDERKETDHQYGVRLDTTVEKFKIGDSQLGIVGSDVYVKSKRYKGTQGLYELLFKKYPNKALFNDEDVENYRRISLYDLYQADLMDMTKYVKENRGYKFILVVINCFSKYVWCEPLKNKSGPVVARAMEQRQHARTEEQTFIMFIIDVQRFSCGSTFICKEIAILNVASGTYVQKMLNIPQHFEWLEKKVQHQMGWILRNINGLQWSTCSNEFLNYEQLSEFTKKIVKDNVLVKGLEKKKWLERFISNRTIDFHDEGCPNLEKLKTVFKSYHCNQHFYNDYIVHLRILQCVGNFSKIKSDFAVLKAYLSKFKRKLSKRKFSHRYVQWEEVESCSNKRMKSGIITNINVKDPIIFLRKAFRSFRVHIRKQLKNSVIKVNVVFVGVFIKPQNAETSIKHFVTKSEIIDNNTNLKKWYMKYVNDKMLVKFDDFQEKDSGWALLEILHLKRWYIYICRFTTVYKKFESVINIKNNDPYCSLWSIVCALYPAPKDKNVSRVSSYPHFSKVLKFGNIKFPITLKDIPNFEQLNGLAINVFTVVDKEVAPLLLSKSNHSPRINLLMLSCNNCRNEEPPAKKPKKTIIPSTVNTDTPQDPVGIRSTIPKELLGEYIRGTIHCGQCKTFFASAKNP
nr:unnamed protein product [Callosobruchus analis]